MVKSGLFLSVLLAVLLVNSSCYAQSQDRKVYIIFVDDSLSTKTAQLSLLAKVLEGSTPEESLIYSFEHSLRGIFVAKFTDNEVNELKSLDGVLNVILSRKFELLHGLAPPSDDEDVNVLYALHDTLAPTNQ